MIFNIRCTAFLIFMIGLVLMSGCSFMSDRDSAPMTQPGDIGSVPDAVPKAEPRSKYGNPPSYVVFGKRYYVLDSSKGFVERGIASWYGTKFHGKRTSSGETYNMYAMTAAHKTLPLPTYVEVTNLENGRRVVVKVNDRGPFHDNRVIDLSYTAATRLDIVGKGTGLVQVRALEPGQGASRQEAMAEEGPAEVRTVALEKPATAVTDFYIQVGAYSDPYNAENILMRLTDTYNELVKISSVNVDGRTLYRVRIGPLTSVERSDEIVAQLEQIGIQEHRIVTD